MRHVVLGRDKLIDDILLIWSDVRHVEVELEYSLSKILNEGSDQHLYNKFVSLYLINLLEA